MATILVKEEIEKFNNLLKSILYTDDGVLRQDWTWASVVESCKTFQRTDTYRIFEGLMANEEYNVTICYRELAEWIKVHLKIGVTAPEFHARGIWFEELE